MALEMIIPTRKTGNERFCYDSTETDINLLEYWSWAHSDLVNNTERGKLAEFIVASALGITDKIGATWDKVDLVYLDKGIEIKSSAYLQSWYQSKESPINFRSKETTAWDPATGKYEKEQKRQADIYVFCFLSHHDKSTVNPIILDQWEFYVVPTALLDELAPKRQSTSLKFLQKNNIKPCKYSEIRLRVEQVISSI